MSNRPDPQSSYDFDLPFGLILGLLGGVLAGLLFAPKPGRELQEDVQKFVNNLPEELGDRFSDSKVRYKEIVGKTKQTIETQMEQRTSRKQATRMAEAKQKEEQEAGSYDY